MRYRLDDSDEWQAFLAHIEELSGEDLYVCYQCGKCSAGCPMADDLDVLPNEVIRRLIIGDASVLEAEAIKQCASCFTCSERCPKGVDLARIMEALRQSILRKADPMVTLEAVSMKDRKDAPQILMVGVCRKQVS